MMIEGMDRNTMMNMNSMSGNSTNNNHNTTTSTTTSSKVCVTPSCTCQLHHSNQYGGGVINSDGTIYINEIKYVQNYLQSFLYIEELQKFKEEEYYRESLELEPDPPANSSSSSHFGVPQSPAANLQSPGKFSHTALTAATAATAAASQPSNYHRKTHSLFNGAHQHPPHHHHHNHYPSPALVAETKDAIYEYKQRHHPLDDSLVETAPVSPNGVSSLTF